jgi:hypothetical protein
VNFGFVLSLVLVILAVVGVFIEILHHARGLEGDLVGLPVLLAAFERSEQAGREHRQRLRHICYSI